MAKAKQKTNKRDINIIDMLMIFLVAAVLIFIAVKAVGFFTSADEKFNNKVELTFTLKNNVEFASVLKQGDTVYIFECSEPLGKIKSVSLDAENGNGVIVVETGFNYDDHIYEIDGVTVMRGKEYSIRTLDFTAEVLCSGIKETAEVIRGEADGQEE